MIRSQKFSSNPNETMVLVADSLLLFYKFTTIPIETHRYDFTSSSANFVRVKITETSDLIHIAAINSVDNTVWYLQVNPTGQLVGVRNISNYF